MDHMKSLLKFILNTIKRDQIENNTQIESPQVKSKNKWLNPKDNFGVLERGKAWSKD